MSEMLTADDYSLPENIQLTCPNGHDITNEVCAGGCERVFYDILNDGTGQVACGVYKKNNGHLCYDCWEKLPESEHDEFS